MHRLLKEEEIEVQKCENKINSFLLFLYHCTKYFSLQDWEDYISIAHQGSILHKIMTFHCTDQRGNVILMYLVSDVWFEVVQAVPPV